MPVLELESYYLPTRNQSAEIKPLQPSRDTISFNHAGKIELSHTLQADLRLERAGFHAGMELKRFIHDINEDLARGKTLYEAVFRSTEVFEFHIRSYDAEFIEQNPVLLHLNRFGFWNGEKKILGNNGRPVVDAVDSRERIGSVKRTAQKIDGDLPDAKNNSFLVLMSPQGVSGYIGDDGRDVPHLNTQTMVFWKDQYGDLKGITLVTDLTIDQAERVMDDLGAPVNFLAKKGTEMQRVANILENPASPSLPEMYKNPFEYVFDRIIAIRGTSDIHLRQKKGNPEVRSVAQIKQKISTFETLLNLNETREKFIQEFKQFILDNYQKVGDPAFQQEVLKKGEETVLLFAEDYLDKKDSVSQGYTTAVSQYSKNQGEISPVRSRDNFMRAIAFLETKAGCPFSALKALAGGGSGDIGATFGSFESDSMGSLYFPCPVCGAINKRPREGYVENCKSCGTDKVACRESGATKKEKQNEDYQFAKAA